MSGSKLAAMAEDGNGGSGGGLPATRQLIRALSPQSSNGRQGDSHHFFCCSWIPRTVIVRLRQLEHGLSFAASIALLMSRMQRRHVSGQHAYVCKICSPTRCLLVDRTVVPVLSGRR
jgi:hypothetical protein